MRKLLAVVTAALVLCLAAGCGNDADKGKNRDKDKPRAAKYSGERGRVSAPSGRRF